MRILVFLMACSSTIPPPLPEVVGPFDGALHRYALDRLLLPPDRLTYADDLDGDGKDDNQLGNVVGALAANDDLAVPGVPEATLELAADDLQSDEHAGVRLQSSDGGDFVGGRIRGGSFVSNRTAETRHPAAMAVLVPLVADADPILLPLVGVELELDAQGNGTLHGAIPIEQVMPLVVVALQQMLARNPAAHVDFKQICDDNKDGTVSDAEISGNAIVKNVIVADVDLFDAAGGWHPGAGGADALSVGFAFHIKR